MKAKQEFGEFNLKRSVSLFRSSDLRNTSDYFTDDEKGGEAFFELLRFEYDGGDHHCEYLRYPNTDYFIELYGSGSSYSHGNMSKTITEDVWKDEYRNQITINQHGSNLMLVIGKYLHEFNFMTLVARFTHSEDEFKFRDDVELPTFNTKELHKSLMLKYVKIPESVRRIEYLYKMNFSGRKPSYFVTDYPAYNFNYTNHRFRIIHDDNVIEELLIKNFERYRDGGTTIITVVDKEGKEHIFYSPTHLTDQKLTPKWDATIIDINKNLVEGVELIEDVSEEERQKIIELLDIDLAPEPKKGE
jgi:uncharacterized protein YrzB (UPF0473 family)